MKQPQIPDNELIRLDTLRSLNVLDTPAEERFDRLTRLARRLFGVPIALVSLVDENRQWFKSCAGLDSSELGRNISFCGHAILGDDIFLINDASSDERFADNPLVTQFPHVRFYAGFPLRHPNGSKLGTLCIIDTRPRALTQDDLQDLRYLAELAERELAAINLATIDELTGLSNRCGFLLLAEQCLRYCVRQNVHASLVYFDIDSLRDINETYGHSEGDKALTIFAEKLRTNFRESDVIGRLDGDEFALLLNDTDATLADAIVGKFDALMREFNSFSRLQFKVTFARGIVTAYPHTNATLEIMLKDADRLMYADKRRQRLQRGQLH